MKIKMMIPKGKDKKGKSLYKEVEKIMPDEKPKIPVFDIPKPEDIK